MVSGEIGKPLPLDLSVPSRYIQDPQESIVTVTSSTFVTKPGQLNQLVRMSVELESHTFQIYLKKKFITNHNLHKLQSIMTALSQ